MSNKKYIDCPTCNAPSLWSPENASRPFCSERCKLIDLGEWASGGYSIAEGQSTSDFSSSDDPSNQSGEGEPQTHQFSPMTKH
ncbi:MAG: DNA gyrase inhibitor YacG [Pontibacterium sp.]